MRQGGPSSVKEEREIGRESEVSPRLYGGAVVVVVFGFLPARSGFGTTKT